MISKYCDNSFIYYAFLCYYPFLHDLKLRNLRECQVDKHGNVLKSNAKDIARIMILQDSLFADNAEVKTCVHEQVIHRCLKYLYMTISMPSFKPE